MKQRIYEQLTQVLDEFSKKSSSDLLGGTSDPYVLIRLGSEEFRSRTAAKTLQPNWNQRFKLYIYKVSLKLAR